MSATVEQLRADLALHTASRVDEATVLIRADAQPGFTSVHVAWRCPDCGREVRAELRLPDSHLERVLASPVFYYLALDTQFAANHP